MDKKEMDIAVALSKGLLDLLPEKQVQAVAQATYAQLLVGLSELVVGLTVNVHVNDEQSYRSVKNRLTDRIKRLDTICEQFDLDSQHEKVKAFMGEGEKPVE